MAAGRGVNEGKTEFVRDYPASHRDANFEQVNQAWSEAGKPGSISVSLVSKERQKAGQTGKAGADRAGRSRTEGQGQGSPEGGEGRAGTRAGCQDGTGQWPG
jgi:hypothetical protein